MRPDLAFQSHHELILNIIFILIDALDCLSAINKPFFNLPPGLAFYIINPPHFKTSVMSSYADSPSSVSFRANHSPLPQLPVKNSFTQFYFPHLHCHSRSLTQTPGQHFSNVYLEMACAQLKTTVPIHAMEY